MTIKNRIAKLEGRNPGVCTCPQEEITPDTDPREAYRIYFQTVHCKVHCAPIDTGHTPEVSPEEAEKTYRKFKNEVSNLIMTGNKF